MYPTDMSLFHRGVSSPLYRQYFPFMPSANPKCIAFYITDHWLKDRLAAPLFGTVMCPDFRWKMSEASTQLSYMQYTERFSTSIIKAIDIFWYDRIPSVPHRVFVLTHLTTQLSAKCFTSLRGTVVLCCVLMGSRPCWPKPPTKKQLQTGHHRVMELQQPTFILLARRVDKRTDQHVARCETEIRREEVIIAHLLIGHTRLTGRTNANLRTANCAAHFNRMSLQC